MISDTDQPPFVAVASVPKAGMPQCHIYDFSGPDAVDRE